MNVFTNKYSKSQKVRSDVDLRRRTERIACRVGSDECDYSHSFRDSDKVFPQHTRL